MKITMRLRAACLVLAWGSAAIGVIGFYQPWAMIDVRQPRIIKQLRDTAGLSETVQGLTRDVSRIAVEIRRGAETVTGELPSLSDIPKTISGDQIPRLADNSKAQIVVAVIELLTNTRQDVQWKSRLVYLVPGAAILCAILLTLLGGWPWLAGMVGMFCAAIAALGYWKLTTTNTNTLLMAITIGKGLWFSVWAYAGLAASALALMVVRLVASRGAR